MMYIIKAILLALALSLPLYPAAYMLLGDGGVEGCITDTECMAQYGGDGGPESN